jgi:hypothetical protein
MFPKGCEVPNLHSDGERSWAHPLQRYFLSIPSLNSFLWAPHKPMASCFHN